MNYESKDPLIRVSTLSKDYEGLKYEVEKRCSPINESSPTIRKFLVASERLVYELKRLLIDYDYMKKDYDRLLNASTVLERSARSLELSNNALQSLLDLKTRANEDAK